MKKISSVLFLLFFAAALSGCGYNTMQTNEEAVIAAWGDVEAAYQRRADLVPNLVEAVREYADHERQTLTAVTEARARAGRFAKGRALLDDPEALAGFNSVQQELGSTLSRLMVVVERYPDIRASQNFRTLQYQLEGTENRINIARIRYNDAVFTFNSSIRKFPNRLTNRYLLKLGKREPFKGGPGVDVAPVVAKK